MTGQKIRFDGKVLAVYGPMVKRRFEIPEEGASRSSRDTDRQECTCALCRSHGIQTQNLPSERDHSSASVPVTDRGI